MPAPEGTKRGLSGGFARSVIVTRPASEAQRWVTQLRQRGIQAESLPLIDIASVPDLAPARTVWAQLAHYAALMFVSGNAVEHFFAARPAQAGLVDTNSTIRALPQLRFMAPGPGTARALVAQGVPPAQIDTPSAEAAQFDSESLWEVLQQRDWAGRRVLIVRGQSESSAEAVSEGREWLARQLEKAGAKVDFVAVYTRCAPQFTVEQLQRIARAQHDASVWLFSSAQGLAYLTAGASAANADWSRACAIATHARIASAARAAGWGVVIESRPTLDDIIGSIESLDS
jgi:uroporphyrinogen-III synthase